jgi:hypothetical protein
MKTYRPLLLSTLIKHRACMDQVALFRTKFGQSVNVSVGLCRKHARLFDWDWAACNLLSPSASAAYSAAIASASAAYRAAMAPASAAYAAAVASAWAAYDAADDRASAAYRAADARAWAAYAAAVARAFACAYINDKDPTP